MDSFPVVPLVTYAAIHDQIRDGDILLCSGTAVFSQLIQHATGSPWSHVGFILRLARLERIMCLESVESIGIRAGPLRHYVENYNGSAKPYPGRIFIARHAGVEPLTPEQFCTSSKAAIDLLNYPYDTKEVLSIAARIVAGKLGMRPHGFIRNHSYICSEYVWTFLASMGLDVPYDPHGFIAPRDFARCPDITLLWEIALAHGA